MKKILLAFVFFISINAFAQQDAWIYFNAKDNVQNFYNNPLQMLSQRALDRRTTQNIPLDFKDVPISSAFVNQVASAVGITVMAQSKWLNSVHVRGTQSNINALSSLTFVSSIDFANASLNSATSGKFTVKNRIKSENKNLSTQVIFNYGNSNNQIQMLNGNLLHQQDYTGTGKIIAILDSGFQGVNTSAPFARLRNNNLILGGYNFVNRNSNIYTSDSHGTLVLSTMGGFVNNQLVGTAPDAAYYLYITEDVASENPIEESLWVEAAEMADSLGVDIINTSLGYFGYDNANYSYTYNDMNGVTSFIARGADIAFSRGMIVVVSAGNSGNSSNPKIATPADAINVLTVGAVNAAQQYVGFSSIGPSSDNRVKPDVMAKGQSTTVSSASGTITTANGTSFSAPIIAGMVASLWQALPTKTNAEIMQLIKQSASNFSTPNPQLGYGIPNFNMALNNALALQDNHSNAFTIYPNPVQNQINFTFPAAFNAGVITFYNALGQAVYTTEITAAKKSLSLQNLANGLYFYTIQSKFFLQSGKVLKQ